MATSNITLETSTEVFKGDRVICDGVERTLGAVALNTGVYSANFQVDGIDTILASTPTSVYRLDHDNLTIDGTPTATTATVLDSRTGLIASGDTVLLDGVGVVCNPVVETDVSTLVPDGSLNTSIINAVPTMTSDTAPSGVSSASSVNSAGFEAYKAFDNVVTVDAWVTGATTSAWLQYQFPTTKIINKYRLDSISEVARMPSAWTLEASNTGAFAGEEVILDTVTGQTSWVNAEQRTFTFTNSATYVYYRLNISNNNGAGFVGLQQLSLIEALNDGTLYQAPITATSAPATKAYFNKTIDTTISAQPTGKCKSSTVTQIGVL